MAATLLPNAKQQFFDANGDPLASGTVTFYIPGTSTLKNTYQDGAQTILNTNPVVLDAAGETIIFGQGAYRQLVKDSLGNIIWDQLTYDTSIPFGTSTTSVTIGTGPQTFITQPGLGFVVGMALLVSQSGIPANYMTGTVTAYNQGTGSLTINVLAIGGSGTIAGWNIVLTGPAGPAGATGATGATGGFLGPEATLVSATTTNLGSTAVFAVLVTGTTTITSFGSSASINNPIYFVRFSGILTLTQNATSLILPGAANITTAAGDAGIFKYEGSGNWRCIEYTKANGMSVISTTGVVTVKKQSFISSGTYTPSTGMLYCIAEVVGGGGGGGGGTTITGGGGGSGAYGRSVITAVTIGASQVVTIGAAGAAGTGNAAGGTGGTSSLGALISCTGGSGGAGGTGTTISGGAGGISSSADLNVLGGYGDNGGSTAGGSGASSYFGGGGRGDVSTNATAGQAYGSGGGGGVGTGAAGKAGLIFITEFCSQ